MNQRHKYQAYAAATQTVARTRQIVILYDGAIRLMQQAREAVKENRIEDRYNALSKSLEIIDGLQGCLDFDEGNEVARVLYGFYGSLHARIFSIHRSNDLATCDEIIADLKTMREAWHSIDQNASEPAGASGRAGERPVDEPRLSLPLDLENYVFSA